MPNMLAFSPDRRVLFAGQWPNYTVGAWDMASGKKSKEYARGHSFALSSKGDMVISISGSSGRYMVWEADSGHILNEWEPDGWAGMAFSPDGKRAPIGKDGKENGLEMYDVDSGKKLNVFSLPIQCHCLACSPDGIHAFGSSAAGQIVKIDLSKKDGAPEVFRTAHFAPVYVWVSPDGKTLASSDDDGHVVLWDTATADKIWDWRGKGVRVAFSPMAGTLPRATRTARYTYCASCPVRRTRPSNACRLVRDGRRTRDST